MHHCEAGAKSQKYGTGASRCSGAKFGSRIKNGGTMLNVGGGGDWGSGVTTPWADASGLPAAAARCDSRSAALRRRGLMRAAGAGARARATRGWTQPGTGAVRSDGRRSLGRRCGKHACKRRICGSLWKKAVGREGAVQRLERDKEGPELFRKFIAWWVPYMTIWHPPHVAAKLGFSIGSKTVLRGNFSF